MPGNKPPTPGRLRGAAFSTPASCGRPARRNRRTQLADGRAPQRSSAGPPRPRAGAGAVAGAGRAGRGSSAPFRSAAVPAARRPPAPLRHFVGSAEPRARPRTEPRTEPRRALAHRRSPSLRAGGERPQGKGAAGAGFPRVSAPRGHAAVPKSLRAAARLRNAESSAAFSHLKEDGAARAGAAGKLPRCVRGSAAGDGVGAAALPSACVPPEVPPHLAPCPSAQSGAPVSPALVASLPTCSQVAGLSLLLLCHCFPPFKLASQSALPGAGEEQLAAAIIPSYARVSRVRCPAAFLPRSRSLRTFPGVLPPPAPLPAMTRSPVCIAPVRCAPRVTRARGGEQVFWHLVE